MKEIVRIKFGSELYGTGTPTSDKDIKGVFLPSKEEILLGRIPKSISLSSNKSNGKNTKNDVDIELYSLHYFIKLACDGETVALDMLHAPKEMLIFPWQEYSWKKSYEKYIWNDLLVKNRSKFYTKNLKAFVGYCKSQMNKYSIKGEKLITTKKVLDAINSYVISDYTPYFDKWNMSLKGIWNILPDEEEYIRKYYDEVTNLNIYEVCGKKVQETASVKYLYDIIERFYNSYGERAKKAQSNSGIDWKAVSHALRVAYEVKEILTEGTITFPLKEREFIKKVKLGEVSYVNTVIPKLEELIAEVEDLSNKSSLPEKVDKNYWDSVIINIVEKYIL